MDHVPYIINVVSQSEGVRLQERLGVAEEGIGIMAPMCVSRLVHVAGLNSRDANVLKQEMLSLGGDVALPADVYDLDGEPAEALIIGTPAQLAGLVEKLRRHGASLAGLAGRLERCVNSYESSRDRERPLPPALGISDWGVMGILNVTPDSFHDGGRYGDPEKARARAEEMVAAGASVIDVGGESTRPGSGRVDEREELSRVLPVIEAVTGLGVPVSIDTYKEPVARAALERGAVMVNDITALRGDQRMAALVAEAGCPVCLMHMKGTPEDMQHNPSYEDVIGEILEFFLERAEWSIRQGVEEKNIIIDPGIGFGKRVEDNLEIINRLDSFLSLGFPVMIGTSRKSFLGKVLEEESTEGRLTGTLATTVMAFERGARLFRVHDVGENRDALMTAATVGRQP